MDFQTTIFGVTCSIFLNNFQRSQNKFNDISESLALLKEILISGEMEFPKINTDTLESFDNTNITFQKTYTSLTEVDENGKSVGFSRLKIYEESDPNIDSQLDILDDEYKNIILQLQSIYTIANKNMDNFRLLLYLLTDVSDILLSKAQFNNFDFYTTLFRYLYKKEVDTTFNDETNLKNNQVLSIPTILAYSVFRKLYYNSTDVVKTTVNNIYNDNDNILLANSYLTNEFKTYLNLNLSSIGIDISKYINNNILMFGSHTSENVFLLLRNAVETQIPKLQIVLDSIGKTLNPADWIYRIINNTIESNSNTTALYNILNKKHYIWNLSNFTTYDSDVHDKFYQYEDQILNSAVTYINKHVGTIKQIVNIPVKFTTNPIFFINTFSVIFSKYALNYMQDTDVFTYSDLSNWLNSCLTTNDSKINNIYSYFKTNPLQYFRNDLNFNLFLILQEYITHLVEHDDFKQFIMKDFIPYINKTISQEYKINILWYENVDKIIYLFKLIFCNDLLTACSGSESKLFSNVVTLFDNLISTSILQAPLTLTKLEITTSFEFERNDTTKWFNLLNSYFKNSIISKYVQKYMVDTYSL